VVVFPTPNAPFSHTITESPYTRNVQTGVGKIVVVDDEVGMAERVPLAPSIATSICRRARSAPTAATMRPRTRLLALLTTGSPFPSRPVGIAAHRNRSNNDRFGAASQADGQRHASNLTYDRAMMVP
jgi:hypothetical protein